MCEHGHQQHEVKRFVLEREAVLARQEAPHGVVVSVVDVGHLKVKVRIPGRNRLVTPVDSARHHVDSFVPALQPSGKADGGPAHSAANIEDVLIRTETPQIHEERPKLVSGCAKVTTPHEPQAAWRSQGIASAKGRFVGVESNRTHECGRAYESDVLEFAAQLPRHCCDRPSLLCRAAFGIDFGHRSTTYLARATTAPAEGTPVSDCSASA